MFAGVDGSNRLYETPEEHLPAALRVRLPAEPEDGHPRRRRALRRLPRAAARRRDPERLVPDDHPRHDHQRLRGADPAELGRRASQQARSWSRSATRTAGSRASEPRSTSSTRTRRCRSSSATRSASSASCRGASSSRPPTSATTATTSRSSATSTPLPNEYLNTDNSRTAAMNANNTFLTGSVANPFAGLLPGTSLNNPTIARSQLLRPYPAVPGHHDDEQRRQVVVPLRPVRPAEAVLEGLHAGRLLHLLELEAGDGVPERGRRGADQDDLGPGRDAPAVAQRHRRAAVREGPPVPVGCERVRERRCSAAGRSRASTPTRAASPSRSGASASPPEPPRATSSTTAATSRISDPTTAPVVQHRRLHVDPERLVDERDAGQPPADAPVPVRRRAPGLHQQHRPVAHQERPVQGRRAAPAAGRVHQRLQRGLLPARSSARRPPPSDRSRPRTRPTTPGAPRSGSSSCSDMERPVK